VHRRALLVNFKSANGNWTGKDPGFGLEGTSWISRGILGRKRWGGEGTGVFR